jgi:curved DNA-binding protein CbpA
MLMRRFTNVNYYAVLGVTSDATREQIRSAYRVKVRTAHPDTGGDHELFAQIAEAWEVLGNPDEREVYDADRKLRGRTARPYATRLTRDDVTSSATHGSSAGRAAPADAAASSREQWMKNKRRL